MRPRHSVGALGRIRTHTELCRRQSHYPFCYEGVYLAGYEGVEPPPEVLETAVLP